MKTKSARKAPRKGPEEATSRRAAGTVSGHPSGDGGAECCESSRRMLLLKRLSRVEGQVRGISRMVEEDRYCIDILTQMAAVHEALRSAGREILENHMHTCVAEALTSGDSNEADRVSRELGTLLTRMSR